MSSCATPAGETASASDGAEGDRVAIAELAAAYAELNGLLLETPDVNEFLTGLATPAASIIPNTSCGITLHRDRELVTVATSDDIAMGVDEIQYGRGQGPCLQALHNCETVHSADLADDHRWGDCRVHALRYGVGSSRSLPLVVGGKCRGALNLHSRIPNAFDSRAIEHGRAFAVLREVSQTRNRKVREVAADLVESITGKPPRPGRPFTDPR